VPETDWHLCIWYINASTQYMCIYIVITAAVYRVIYPKIFACIVGITKQCDRRAVIDQRSYIIMMLRAIYYTCAGNRTSDVGAAIDRARENALCCLRPIDSYCKILYTLGTYAYMMIYHRHIFSFH